MRHGRQAGYTYLLLLFVVAVAGYGLALLGESWRNVACRELSLESAFILEAYARALEAYRLATPDGQPYRPRQLQELLDDRRSGARRRHLRQLYVNPWSGAPDWVLQRDEQGIVDVALPSAGGRLASCRAR